MPPSSPPQELVRIAVASYHLFYKRQWRTQIENNMLCGLMEFVSFWQPKKTFTPFMTILLSLSMAPEMPPPLKVKLCWRSASYDEIQSSTNTITILDRSHHNIGRIETPPTKSPKLLRNGLYHTRYVRPLF